MMSEPSSPRRSRFALAALALMAGGLFGGVTVANAAPLAPAPATALASEATVETVQWHHHHFGHRRHHHGHWGHRRHGGHHHW